MKLTLAQIQSITLGAVSVWEAQGLVHFSRFTQQQMEMYQVKNLDFYKKAHATAGIRLCFRTDSQNLSMKVQIEPGSSRKFFSVDIFADGAFVGCVKEQPDRHLGGFSGEFSLGEGEKTVTVHLPWSVAMKLEELCLDAGAFIEPVRPAKSLLMYGDSITQGYDAKQTSMRYATKLADYLDAEEYNRAIGGEVYYAPLVQLEEPVKPDYITIAYGSNDWYKVGRAEFTEQCSAFIKTVSERNPQAQVFVLTPIWRKDLQENRPFGQFADVETIIRQCCEGLSNVEVIRGFDFVPKDESYYADLYLHPNDEGFSYYAENLCKAIAEARK